jgi:hypothetical protein
LVAVLGWKYLDEEVQVSTKPSDLEARLGIAGGTLRPLIKKLKDANLLVTVDGHYSVRVSNLHAIGSAVRGEKPVLSKRTAKRHKVASHS